MRRQIFYFRLSLTNKKAEIMKNIYLLFTFLLCLCCSKLVAQDEQKLLQRAIAQSGTNTIYLRDFSVCFEAAEKGKASKGRYPILMSKNTNYVFSIANDDNYQSRAIMKLYLNGKLITSNYNNKTSAYQNIIKITPEKAATYYLEFSFIDGKAGCTSAVMMKEADNTPKTNIQQLNTLYAQGDNPLYFGEGSQYPLKVSIDNGFILKASATEYIAHPNEDGSALVTIHCLDENEEVLKTLYKRFLVLSLTKPYATLEKMEDGRIRKQELLKSNKIELKLTEKAKSNAKIISFTLSDSDNLISGIVSTANKFNKQQKEWIEKLTPGTRIYIKNIQAKSFDNQIMNLEPLEIVVE